tara:strand:+ start:3535 stop:3759 length:225 start_codon:yes stop_codon:yes gene_type:complete
MDLDTRLELIKKVGKKLNKKVKRNQRIKRTETSHLDRYASDNGNINHYTDASKYAEEYYGDRMRQTTCYDNDWD